MPRRPKTRALRRSKISGMLTFGRRTKYGTVGLMKLSPKGTLWVESPKSGFFIASDLNIRKKK